MQTVPLACFLSMIRPPSIQFETALIQIAPVDKVKCPFVRDINDVTFQLYTRHNPTAAHSLLIDDDERLFSSSIDFHDQTAILFLAFMETPDDGSVMWFREAYMVRGDTNVIIVDSQRLEAGPWYVKAAQNTWYIGRIAGQFIDYLVSRGLQLSKTHLVGHSLGAQTAGVAGGSLRSGRVSRITGLDAALPLFSKVPLEERLDPSDAEFVDVIHTDAGIFGFNLLLGHVDFFPNGGKSPQPGCELKAVLPQQLLLNDFFCSHWRSYMYFAESIIRPRAFVATHCGSQHDYEKGYCAREPSTHMGYGVNRTENEPVGTDRPSKIGNMISIARTINNIRRIGNNMRNNKEKLVDFVTKTKFLPEIEQNNFSIKFNPINILMKKISKKGNQNSKWILNNEKKIESTKTNDISTDKKRRPRRFASFFKSEDNNLLKILDFFVKNRKNIIPVISVIREINTLVKTSTGELNHMIKEQNNYIGTTATLTPVTYNVQFNSDSKIMALLKRIFGFGKEGVTLVT